jgi:hypothetical protein
MMRKMEIVAALQRQNPSTYSKGFVSKPSLPNDNLNGTISSSNVSNDRRTLTDSKCGAMQMLQLQFQNLTLDVLDIMASLYLKMESLTLCIHTRHSYCFSHDTLCACCGLQILTHCNHFVCPPVHEREPTLKQNHVVHDIVDMTSYIEVICETIQ